MGIFSALFPDKNEREIKKLKKIADKVVALEDQFSGMTDEELAACTQKYKDRYAGGESLDSLLPEAFATVREASKRVLGMTPFYVQIIGAIVLHQGRIAEMKTGEGKTLVATMPAYLNALTGDGMHIVTVNEYLAQYQSEWMGKVFRFLGMSVGCNLHELSPEAKQKAYACDVMYTTNSELGFDYLRDNMARAASYRVQRKLAFAIVDEVDSIFIDEARTPLIISGRGELNNEPYEKADKFVRTLKPVHYVCPECGKRFSLSDFEEGETAICPDCEVECEREGDYERVEKDKSVYLNENGAEKAERYYGIEDLSDFENQDIKHYIDNALRAHVTMHRDSDYIVENGEVLIVDEFTGRKMPGRRYSNGLHQAIEAKEKVRIHADNVTVASITYQNFFKLYKKLSGMTGTAKTEENEFSSIYKLDVVVIPTNKPTIRKDENDRIYMTMAGKIKAVVEDVEECYKRKQPVLIGTVSVEKSELFSKKLNEKKIPHVVLNAKNNALEAEIVAQAGKLGAVTIATNMAGRGTDILLGGNPEFLAKQKMENMGYPHEIIDAATSHVATEDPEILKARADYKKYFELFKKDTDEEKQKVIELGGLRIIGTEKHESRRIDNQLRGRSGRQGDPGSSVFYVSLEDDLMRLFGSQTLIDFARRADKEDNMYASFGMLTKQINHAQARVEDRNFSIRKHLLGYDDVLNKQREIIYEQRRIVLDELDVHEQIMAMMKSVIERACEPYLNSKLDYSQWDYEEFNKTLSHAGLPKGCELITPEFVEDHDTQEEFVEAVYEYACKQYEEKLKEAAEATNAPVEELERYTLLRVVDTKWTAHMSAMEDLRTSVSLLAYGQRDPVMVYRNEGFEMFDKMVEDIQQTVVNTLVNANWTVAPQKKAASPYAKKLEMRQTDASYMAYREKLKSEAGNQQSKPQPQKQEPIRVEKKPNPNDMCPCGSGKKYKDCCGRTGNYYKG